jgi:beta-lactamase regulating signal transducer with metallopeptidase domain
VETLLAMGLWNALGATLLALVAASVGRICRRPAIVHALWLLVLLKLVTPPMWSITIPQSKPQLTDVAEVERPVPAFVFRQPNLQEISEEVPQPPAEQVPVFDPPLAVEALPNLDLEPEPQPASNWPWMETILAVWAGGAILCCCLSALRVARFHRMLRRLCPAAEELQERVRRLAAKLGLRRGPVMYLVAAPISPMVWALTGRARLLVPQVLWDGLSDVQRDLMLVHELAHLRRRDHLVRLLELLIVGLYWWFPVAWLARRRLQEAAELCCDAWVVAIFPQAGEDYAATLVDSASYLSQNAVPVPAGASGLGPVPLLRRRITMILNDKIPPRLSWTTMVLVLAAAAALLPLWPTGAEPLAEPEAVAADNSEAQRDLNIARFWERAGHPGSARFYYQIVQQRYPGTTEAEEAAKQLKELDEKAVSKAQTVQPPKVVPPPPDKDESDAQRDLRIARFWEREGHQGSAHFYYQIVQRRYPGTTEAEEAAKKISDLEENALLSAMGKQPTPSSKANDSLVFLETKFDRLEHDFGAVKRGSTVSHEFKLTNTSKNEWLSIGPMRVTNGAATCVCDKTILEPGGSAAIVVSIDTKRFTGSRTIAAHVTIGRGGDNQTTAVLRLSADSRDEVDPAAQQPQLKNPPIVVRPNVPPTPALSQATQPPQVVPAPVVFNSDPLAPYRDDIELLKVKCQIEAARLALAEAELKAAAQRHMLNEKLAAEGNVNAGTVLSAKQEVESRSAAVRVQKAQLQYAELELKQAIRRLADMVPATPPPAPKPATEPKTDDPRVLDIQKKIAAKIRELDTLRSQLKNINDTAPKEKQTKGGQMLSVSPAMLDLGKVRLGQRMQRKVKVYAHSPLHFKWVQGLDSELLVTAVETVSDDSAETVTLTLNLAPREVGEFKRTLQVVTKEGNETVEFTVVAQVIQ